MDPYSYSTDQNLYRSELHHGTRVESSLPAENFTNWQRKVIFVRDFHFFGFILNEKKFYCRVKLFLIQAVCMCIFHRFCSIFNVFLRIDSSILSYSLQKRKELENSIESPMCNHPYFADKISREEFRRHGIRP